MKTKYIRKVFITSKMEKVEVYEKDALLQTYDERGNNLTSKELNRRNTKVLDVTPSDYIPASGIIYESSFSDSESYTSSVGEFQTTEDELSDFQNSILGYAAATSVSATVIEYLRVVFDFVVYSISVTINSSNYEILSLIGKLTNRKNICALTTTVTCFVILSKYLIYFDFSFAASVAWHIKTL